MKKRNILLFKIVIIVVLFVLLFNYVKMDNLIYKFKDINILIVLFLFLFYILSWTLSFITLWLLLSSLNRKITFFMSYGFFLLACGLNTIVPAKTGNLLFVPVLKRKKLLENGGTLAAIFLDKTISLIVASLISIVGFFIFFPVHRWMLSIILVIGIISLFFFIYSKKLKLLIVKYFLGRYACFFKGFSNSLKFILQKRKRILFYNVLLTILKLLVISLCIKLIFFEFGISVSLLPLLYVHAACIIFALIPLNFLGIGVTQPALVLLYHKIGIDISLATLVMALLLFSFYVLAIFIYVFSFLINAKKD